MTASGTTERAGNDERPGRDSAVLASVPSRGQLVSEVMVCRPALRSAASRLAATPSSPRSRQFALCSAIGVIGGPCGMARDCRQSPGIPILSASDAPPAAAGIERGLGH